MLMTCAWCEKKVDHGCNIILYAVPDQVSIGSVFLCDNCTPFQIQKKQQLVTYQGIVKRDQA